MKRLRELETHATAACADVGLIGRDLVASVVPHIVSGLLLRRGSDIVHIQGDVGSGKTRLAHACHRAMVRTFGEPRTVIDAIEQKAHDNGTGLLFDHVTELESIHQHRVITALDAFERHTAETPSNAALCLLTSSVPEHGEPCKITGRAAAHIVIPPLHERSNDAASIAQHIAMETAQHIATQDFAGLTRQAQQDVVAAVTQAKVTNVRTLRTAIREAMFQREATGAASDVLDSMALMPTLERHFAFNETSRHVHELHALRGPHSPTEHMQSVATLHDIPAEALEELCHGVQGIINGMDEPSRSYKNIVERTNRMSKIALWLLSGAQTQAQFRRFFGSTGVTMPPKSVAHQIYHEVFPEQRAP